MANQYKNDPFVHGWNTAKFAARIVEIQEPKGPAGKKWRVRARIIGLQDDVNSMPDNTLPWYDVMVPPDNQGASPYLRQGMQVIVENFGGEAGTTASAFISGITDWYPLNGAMQGEDEQVKLAKLEDNPPPQQKQDSPMPNKAGYNVAKIDKTTQQSREQDHPYSWGPSVKKRTADPEQNFHKQENVFKEKGIKFPEDLTTGAYKFDNQKDAQKFIKNSINNQGAFIPTALQMIQNLKKVGNGQNPNSIKAVGAGNFFQALKDIAKHFSNQNKKPSNPCLLLATDPLSVDPDQVEECCKLDNRRNLPAKAREYCEYLDSLKVANEEDSQFQEDEGIDNEGIA